MKKIVKTPFVHFFISLTLLATVLLSTGCGGSPGQEFCKIFVCP